MQNLKKYILIFILAFVVQIDATYAIEKNKTNQNNQSLEINQDINNNSENDKFLFDYLTDELKKQYADARLSARELDTMAVQFEFNQMLFILNDLDELSDSLGMDQEEYLEALNRMVHEDFIGFLPEEQQAFAKNQLLKDQILFLETQNRGLDKEGFTVIDDREGHLPVILNSRVQKMIDFLKDNRHDEFQTWLNRYGQYYSTIVPILKSYELPEELIFLALMESGLNPNAYSYAHASGPWQFISSTGKQYGLKRTWWIDERRDLIKSTHSASRYLKTLHDEFENWYLAMSAYNAGEARIRRAIQREDHRDYWRLISLPRETRNYIPSILAASIIAKNPQKYGFEIPSIEKWEYDEIIVEKPIDLDFIASGLGVKFSEIKDLNTELRQGVTPPDYKQYTLRIPKGSYAQAYKVITSAPKSTKTSSIVHKVKRGETLSTIARKHGVSMRSIARSNNLKNYNQLRVGQKLTITNATKSKNMSSYSSGLKKVTLPENRYKKITYVVKKGDTLGQIAENYDTRASRIRQWNAMQYRDYIYPGQRLTIYVAKKNG
jgi:membrane-bound lytic murein transglycosylase D